MGKRLAARRNWTTRSRRPGCYSLNNLDGLEQDRADEAALDGKKYHFILDKPYRWEQWAAPKGKDGTLDHNKAQTGDDLRDFVNQKLFPYLHGFKLKATGPNTIEYKIGEIFGEIKNKISSGYNLREIIDHIDELRFRSQAEKHELSHLYEAKIKNMGNAGRNGGEYYTPRPLIRAMVKVIRPTIGERIYDGACGSAGFLCESFDYLKAKKNLTTKDFKTLQERTFYGKEKKSLAYVIAIMNMILHGIEAPNIVHTNTLTENLADIQDKDRFDVVLANPPFGGKERKEVQQNFPIRTGETAFLFLQHFIKMLKAGGRGGVVIKNTFLSNTDNASTSLRKLLLESCTLHTVLDCPGGTFQGAGVKTVVLFFEKGSPTRKVWFYQLDPGRNLGKTNPLNDADLAEFVTLQKTFADSPKSWRIDAKKHRQDHIRSVRQEPKRRRSKFAPESPSYYGGNCGAGQRVCRSPAKHPGTVMKNGWVQKRLGDVVTRLTNGYVGPTRDIYVEEGIPYLLARHVKDNALTFDGKTFISDEFNRKNKKSTLKAGDVLLVQTGHIGHSAVVTEEHDGHNCHAMIVITPMKDVVAGPFLSLYFNSPEMRHRFDDIRSGSTVPHLTCGAVKEMKIPIPPLPEQRRIIRILDEALDGIATAKANAEKNLQNARALFESLLNFAFERRGEGWAKKTLGDVCQFENGDRGKNYPNRNEYVETGIPWINTGHIQPDGTLSQSEMNFISREKYESLRSGKIKPGDLVYCLRGATLGKTALVKPLTTGAVASSLVIIRPSAVLDSQFLYFFLTSPLGQGLIKGYENGAAQPNLGAKSVAKYPISLPSLAQQKIIVNDLTDLATKTQRLASLYARKVVALEALKKSLLHRAFNGEL